MSLSFIAIDLCDEGIEMRLGTERILAQDSRTWIRLTCYGLIQWKTEGNRGSGEAPSHNSWARIVTTSGHRKST